MVVQINQFIWPFHRRIKTVRITKKRKFKSRKKNKIKKPKKNKRSHRPINYSRETVATSALATRTTPQQVRKALAKNRQEKKLVHMHTHTSLPYNKRKWRQPVFAEYLHRNGCHISFIGSSKRSLSLFPRPSQLGALSIFTRAEADFFHYCLRILPGGGSIWAKAGFSLCVCEFECGATKSFPEVVVRYPETLASARRMYIVEMWGYSRRGNFL